MDRSIVRAAIGLMAWTASSALAAPVSVNAYDLTGAKAFSNLCTNPMTDDTDGLRVYVRRSGQTPRVVAQYAEGGLDPPIEAPSKVIGARLRFVVPGDAPEAMFTGEVFDGYVVVRGAKRGTKPFRLNRVKVESRLPRCR